MNNVLRHVGRQFGFEGELLESRKIGLGHINDTYEVSYDAPGGADHVVHQRINHNVFKDPVSLMGNVERVLAHLASKCGDVEDIEILRLAPARDDSAWWRDDEGYVWRTYAFVEGTCYRTVESPDPVRIAAAAFGQFQAHLMDMPEPRLHETIPHFHDTPKRLRDFNKALSADARNRAASASDEIDFAMEHEGMTGIIQAMLDNGEIPERIVHNDAKLNNVLIDTSRGNRACVIDLDTVMPGSALYDFGDLIRTMISPGAEDAKDLAGIEVQMPLFETVAGGYLSRAGKFLTRTEREHLVLAGKLITFECGLRFLTDYLQGDVYFKIDRLDHNLDRCRTQFQLVRSIEKHEQEMEKIVRELG